MKKSPSNIESLMLFLLPIVVFFSYYPLIKLGENDSMYFELSLPIIWLAIFGVVSLCRMPKIAKKYGWLKTAIICAFPVYATMSILWSDNKLRGVLTAGILWLIVFSVVNIVNLKLNKIYLKKLLKVYLISSGIVAGFCILQCFLDVWGVPRDYTLLCPGCVYSTLGFPHPNGLAIEPQFMGNLLIAPSLITLWLFYNAIKSKKDKRTMFGYGLLSFYLIMSLYICFSRGALYAFGVAGIVFGIALLIQERKFLPLWLLAPTIMGCLAGLLVQGLLAEISPTAENFAQGIQRSIHQVTMGRIDIREKVDQNENQSDFTGYIEESTDIRLNINDVALKTWREKNVLVGVGIGGAGTAMSADMNGNKKEIIQNEYINILTELGIIGAVILLVTIGYLIKNTKKPIIILIPIIIAYLITLSFFSGFPNVLHIYLVTPLLSHLGQKR